MDELFGSQIEDPADTRERRRVERAVFETDRQLIEGDLTLPPAGYQSRFSDSLNRGEFEFVPLTRSEKRKIANSASRGEMKAKRTRRQAMRGRYPLGRAPFQSVHRFVISLA